MLINSTLRRALALMLAATTLLGVAQPSQALTTPVIKLDSGPVQGRDDGVMKSYIGIPYAAPPVGELRWRPPQRPDPWTKTLQATHSGNSCPQNADLGAFATAGGDEDCLYVNVYAPHDAAHTGKSLPVFV